MTMANTPQPCCRCTHLYVDPMIPDDVIATTGPLYGRDCFADQPLSSRDRPDHDCPKFEEE
jgi:hypothetical protein